MALGRQRLTDSQRSFGGGLNTVADESQLAGNELRRAANCRLTEFGGVTKRLGSQRTHSSSIGTGQPVRGGFAWIKPTSVQELAVSNGTLYTGTYSIGMSWTAQAGALTSTVYPSFAPFRENSGADVVYIADGGLLNKWDGTTFTVNIASTPSVKRVCVYNRRLFGIGDTAQPTRLYYSALDNGDSLGITGSAGGAADIRTFGFMDLVGLMVIGGSLLIFHRQGISRFTGWSQDDIAIQSGTVGISSDVGTIAPDSLVSVENVGFFLSDRGIYSVTEEGVEPISTKIEADIEAALQTNFLRVKTAHNKSAREVLFYIPDLGVYVYNYRLRAWSGPWTGVFTDVTTYSLWPTLDTDSNPIVLMGGGDGFVRHVDKSGVYKDDVISAGTGGATFTMIAQCRRMFFGDSAADKSLRWGYLVGNLRGSITTGIEWNTRTGQESYTVPATAGGIWGAGTWGSGFWGGSGSDTFRIPMSGRGTFVDVTMTDAAEAAPLFSSFEVEGFYMTRRGG